MKMNGIDNAKNAIKEKLALIKEINFQNLNPKNFKLNKKTFLVAALVIVIPRSCSWTIQSITAVPSSTVPILYTLPVKNRMRSVVVVLPASM